MNISKSLALRLTNNIRVLDHIACLITGPIVGLEADISKADELAREIADMNGITRTSVRSGDEETILNVFAQDAYALHRIEHDILSQRRLTYHATRQCPGFQVAPDGKTANLIRNAMRAAGIEPRDKNDLLGTEACIFNARGVEMPIIGVDLQDEHETTESVSIERVLAPLAMG